jgi:diguanylate cyclase (GGDEF)-like protein
MQDAGTGPAAGLVIALASLILVETAAVAGLLVRLMWRRKAAKDLRDLNADLERRIAERSKELAGVNAQLDAARERGAALNSLLDLASRTDGLTGLFDRRHIEEKIQEERDRYSRTKAVFSTIMADVDSLGKVNDRYGRLAGDAILRAVAQDIRKLVRSYDVVARWGDGEFLVLLPHTSAADAAGLAERIGKTIAEREYEYGGLLLSVTLSHGVSTIAGRESAADCVSRAEAALFEGKAARRNPAVEGGAISSSPSGSPTRSAGGPS